jgi:hypothetical protein
MRQESQFRSSLESRVKCGRQYRTGVQDILERHRLCIVEVQFCELARVDTVPQKTDTMNFISHVRTFKVHHRDFPI